MVPYAAYLFDLDGTLVDSAPDIARALNRLLRELGLGTVPEALARGWIGDGSRMLITRALAHHGREPEDVDALFERFIEHYAEGTGGPETLYPGALHTLATLAERGVPLACVTNKPAHLTDLVLRATGTAGYFGAVLGAGTLPERKPDPRPLLVACERLGVAPEQALMVGDSAVDLQAARNAGCPFCLVSFGYWRHADGPVPEGQWTVDRLDALVAGDPARLEGVGAPHA